MHSNTLQSCQTPKKRHPIQIRGLRQQHESVLANARAAAASELRQRESQLQAEILALRDTIQQQSTGPATSKSVAPVARDVSCILFWAMRCQ